MLSADGGGGGTDWSGMSIEMMRALIQNPNVEAHYELLTGWQRSYELVSDHMMQVQSYRDNLAAAWPPDKSAASNIYLNRLDEMIGNLNETYEAALANHDAFASATQSISLAQQDFEAIWQEHEANKSKLAEYQADLAMSSAATFDTTPPVTAMQQEAVRQKAITLMSTVSSDLAQAQVRVVRPTPYQPPTPIDDKTEAFPGTASAAPPIPHITPSFAGSGKGSSSTRPSTGTDTTAPSGVQFTTHPITDVRQPGLVLGGASPQISPPIAPADTPAAPPVPSSGPGPFINPGLGMPIQAGGKTSFPPGTTGPGPGLPPVETVIRPSTGIPGAMPPGGIIGGMVGGGLGQPGANRPGTRQVNPVGGVIGGGEPGNRLGGRGAAAYGPGGVVGGRVGPAPERAGGPSARSTSGPGRSAVDSYGQSAGRRAGKREHSETSRWDPENPWETAEGVDPVVLPPKEQRVDPGPVIGLP